METLLELSPYNRIDIVAGRESLWKIQPLLSEMI